MKTARVSVAPIGVGSGANSAAVESAVDAFAARVLESMSPSDVLVDSSLGPYVTSLLRCAEIHDKDDVTSLSEFDSLLELLEDQCSMNREIATEALKTIASAVCTGIAPPEAGQGRREIHHGLYTGSSLDSFQTLKASQNAVQPHPGGFKFEQLSIDPYTPTSTGAPSPLKPDNLIPVDLLGVLDDPSPGSVQQADKYELQSPATKEMTNDEEAFPPLGAAKSVPSKKGGRGKKGTKAYADKELAAALFRPARPRQNSIEKEESSPQMQAVVPDRGAAINNMYFQQQWDSCVEIILSMNPELSEEAAVEASLMANTDFNIAQYIVDAAMSAPPVCRHMLHDGCYRSDCQFSHDVEGHTCLFWLRGRCGKGTNCKFLHGFNQRLLDAIQFDPPTNGAASDPVPITDGSTCASPYSLSFQPSDGFGGFQFPSRGAEVHGYETNGALASSWQSPSLAESAGSNSYSSGDSKSGANCSFANVAVRGYDKAKFSPAVENNGSSSSSTVPIVRIPQDLWNPHENRDSAVFHIADPLERYQKVASTVKRRDVIDLHFQSTKTFSVVLSTILPGKLAELGEVWIVTGTGHHVGSKTHQKGGGALERSVIQFLSDEGYNFAKGRDRNGLGGAVLVKR